MTSRIPIIVAALLLSASLPLAGQERSAPPSPPSVERLQQLRFERLHEALGLSRQQAAALHEQMMRSYQEMRGSFQRQQEAIEELEEKLATDPVDEEALRRSLAEVEAARAQMEAQRERHMAELERTLSLEQRAKFLLFNRRFDSRLRELVEQHRGRHGEAPRGTPDGVAAPPGPPGRGPDPRQATREQKIEFLEKRIQELERQLEELRSDAES